jgi:hypothetical protein
MDTSYFHQTNGEILEVCVARNHARVLITSRLKALRGHSLAERAVRYDERGSWTVGKGLRVSRTSLSCSFKMESWVGEGEGGILVWKIGYGAERGSW